MSWFCNHKWKEKERYNVTRKYIYHGAVEKGLLIIQECTKCGKLKKVDI